ncbi:MAG: hypothetical protein KGI54_05790 [Pseudomonadota bacterium]|nr:hypothetical protein [Pseudomonadota bacterium]
MKIKTAFEKASLALPKSRHGVSIAGNVIITANDEMQVEVAFDQNNDLFSTQDIVIDQKICKLIKALPNELTLKIADGQLNLTHAEGHYLFKATNELVPSITPPEILLSVTVSGEVLADALNFVADCMSCNDIRQYLNGAYVKFTGDKLVICASNGISLARSEKEVATDNEASFILPFHSAQTIATEAASSDKVIITIGTNHIVQFTFQEFTIRCKTVDGTYPDVDKMIQSLPEETVLSVLPKNLNEAIKTAFILADNTQQTYIELEVGKSQVNCSVKGIQADGTESCEAEVSGKQNIRFTLLGRHVMSALNASRGTTKIARNESGPLVSFESERGLWVIATPRV